MASTFLIRALTLIGLATLIPSAWADDPICGTAPALPTSAESSDSIKGQLQGQADFLSKLVGKAELGGQIEAARRTIYQSSDKFFAAQKDAYLAYIFCVIVMGDKSLSTKEKLGVIKEYRTALPEQHSSSDSSTAKNALLSQYKGVLKQINESINLRNRIVVPAMTEYINNPSIDNWNVVVSGVRRLKEQIDTAIMMAMDYDSNFFDESGSLVEFIDFVDNDTPQVKNIKHTVFSQAVHIWSQKGQSIAQIIETPTPPSREQAQLWSDAFSERASRLRSELIRLIKLLDPQG